MAAATSRKRSGPEHKGARKQFTLRVPDDQYRVYKREADEQGLSLADYLAAALARSHDLPEPGYVHRKRGGEERFMLPLTGTG